MKYQSVLEEEYKKAGKKVVWCTLGKNKIIVPLSYKGEVDRFIDDIFSYEKEADKYNEYNRENKCHENEDHFSAVLQTFCDTHSVTESLICCVS